MPNYLPIPPQGTPPEELGWKEKFMVKFKKDPLVPIGCGITTMFFLNGVYAMQTGIFVYYVRAICTS